MQGINGIANSQLCFHAMKVLAALKRLIIPLAIADGVHTAAPDQLGIVGKVGVETGGGDLLAAALMHRVIGLATEEGNLAENLLQGEVMIGAP